MTKPDVETVENRWDILYRDFPEVYDEFAAVPYVPRPIDVIEKEFGLGNKIVADIGSGSGKSTFQLAEYAKEVAGIEPEASMRKLAVDKARNLGLNNIRICCQSLFCRH